MTEAKTIPVHVRLSPAVHAAVQALAEAEHRKVASLLTLLIEEALEARKHPIPRNRQDDP